MTDRLDILADSLAETACAEAGNAIVGAAVLFQAGGALLVTTFGPDAAHEMLDRTLLRIKTRLEETLGVGKVRQ